MDKLLFVSRLREASEAARDFARRFVEEPLPDPMWYRLRLNRSYDGNPRVGDEVVYREDSRFERANAVSRCTEEQAVEVLWREWIDVSVIDETGSATVIELLCCGRFTARYRSRTPRRSRKDPG